MTVITRKALGPRPFHMGRAVWRGKGIVLHRQPDTFRPLGTEIVAIHFQPVGRAAHVGPPIYKARVVFWPDEDRGQANASDIALVAGRLWFDGNTTQPRRRVEQWLRGRCECCGNEDAWPNLFDEMLPDADGSQEKD